MKQNQKMRFSLMFVAALSLWGQASGAVVGGAVVLGKLLAAAGVLKVFKSGIGAIRNMKADHGTYVRYINNKSNRTYYAFFRSQLEGGLHMYEGKLVIPDGGNVKDGMAIKIPPKSRIELDKLVMKGGDKIDMLIVDSDPVPGTPIGFYVRDTGEKEDKGGCPIRVGKRIRVEFGMLTGPKASDTRMLRCKKMCGRRSRKDVEVTIQRPVTKITDPAWEKPGLIGFRQVEAHADKSDGCAA